MKRFSNLITVGVLLLYIMVLSCASNVPASKPEATNCVVKPLLVTERGDLIPYRNNTIIAVDTLFAVGDTIFTKACARCEAGYYVIVRRGGQ